MITCFSCLKCKPQTKSKTPRSSKRRRYSVSGNQLLNYIAITGNGAIKIKRMFVQKIHPLFHKVFGNASHQFGLSSCKTAFLLNGNRQNRLEGRNKGDVHMLSNHDTNCIHIRASFICAIGCSCLKNQWHEATHGSQTHSCAHLFPALAVASNPSC